MNLYETVTLSPLQKDATKPIIGLVNLPKSNEWAGRVQRRWGKECLKDMCFFFLNYT